MDTANTLTDFIPVLIQVLLASGIAIAILMVTHIFGQRAKSNAIKDLPYECGMETSKPSGHPRFAVKFYVTAMLFIIFDIEVVYLIPWVLIYKEFILNSIPILGPMLFFLFVLVAGLAYELKKGALEWEK